MQSSANCLFRLNAKVVPKRGNAPRGPRKIGNRRYSVRASENAPAPVANGFGNSKNACMGPTRRPGDGTALASGVFTGSFKWVARIKRVDSGSLIVAVSTPFRKSRYSCAIAGVATSISNRFSSQNSMTWKNGLRPRMPRPKVLARQPSRAPIRSTSFASCGTDSNTWNGQVCAGAGFSPNTT
jgi:hypothetical protein